jgi:hypothetical protein
MVRKKAKRGTKPAARKAVAKKGPKKPRKSASPTPARKPPAPAGEESSRRVDLLRSWSPARYSSR